jgi:tetratricopeptide (TPR) repeat protein
MMTAMTRRAVVLLGVTVAIAYASSIFGTFHFDDSHSVENNLAVRSLKNIPLFWTDPSTSSMIPENRVYRPLVYTFYAICWQLGDGSVVPFHIMKMIMHWGVAVFMFLIWRMLWGMPGWWPLTTNLQIHFPFLRKPFELDRNNAALILALVFAVHPAGSECVNYISSTTSLQCALFYVMAYAAYLRGRDPWDWKWIGISLLAYFLSVASKEEGITLVAMVGITELFLRKDAFFERFRQALRAVVPFAAVAFALAFWLYLMHAKEGDESRGFVSPSHYFMTQWRAYLHYMRLWFWPWDLNADSATWEFSTDFFDPRVIQALIGNLLILIVAWSKRAKYPGFLFGVLWFYVTVSPTSSVVVLAEAVNERRMYLAYVAFAGGVATLLLHAAEAWIQESARALKIGWIMTSILVGLVIGTQERNRVWRNDENLWKDTVEKNPTSGRAHNNLALVYMAQKDFGRAIQHLELCEKYWSRYQYCLLNHGVALDALGRLDEAEKKLREAYQVAPRNIHVLFHYARFLADRRNKCADAIPLYQASVKGSGGRYPAADYRTGDCYARLKKWPEAIAAIRNAIEVEPESTFGWFTLGTVQLEAGDYAGGESSFQKLLQLDSKSVQGWYNLGVLRMRRSDLGSARAAFQKTVELDPRSEQGWYNLGFVAEKMGDKQTALQASRQLLSLNPQNGDYQRRMRELEKRFGT